MKPSYGLPLVAVVAFSVALGGCNNSSATVAGVTPVTAIAVDPAEFLGKVPCSDAPGAMRLYVATLTDVSPRKPIGLTDATVFVLPSSLPTSCHLQVLFQGILDGRQYAAAVDGYDRDDIVPVAPGSSVMLDRMTRAYIAPRWTTKCAYRYLPPELSIDGGKHNRDGGPFEYAPLNPAEAFSPKIDGGYGLCRPVPLYGKTRIPWLDGPVCAVTQETVIARGCAPLRD